MINGLKIISLTSKKPIRILQAFGKDQQISAHDFLPGMKEANIQQSPYYNWDGHWNTYGNQAAAESLLRFLIDQKISSYGRIRTISPSSYIEGI